MNRTFSRAGRYNSTQAIGLAPVLKRLTYVNDCFFFQNLPTPSLFS